MGICIGYDVVVVVVVVVIHHIVIFTKQHVFSLNEIRRSTSLDSRYRGTCTMRRWRVAGGSGNRKTILMTALLLLLMRSVEDVDI